MMISDSMWKELETEVNKIPGHGILKRLLAPESTATMFLGIQRPSLSRLFLLEVPRNMLPLKEHIPESRGFELSVEPSAEKLKNHATLVLRATDCVYNEVFSAMVDNLYQILKECKEERQIVRVFLDRLYRWQQFFEKNPQNGLSEEAQRGLYGELYFLKNHLLSTSDHFIAEVSSWTGAMNRQHDFQFGDTVVEVKTSIAKQHQKLKISSEQQLDETLVGNLYIYHLSLSMMENHADTLPNLIAQIQNGLHDVYGATTTFEEALLNRGYLHTQAERYSKTGYAIREFNVFLVTDDFPRITERELPFGVGDLTYSISIAECKKFKAPINELISHIRRNIS
ncbi:MAG: PD-(D/E)XK motif protein [Verrucomicrobia bacterium]|nr:PD-(D/E)XK motif protein [Verrucomicrobiota bacterium]